MPDERGFRNGKIKHPHNDGFNQPLAFHIERAKRQLELMVAEGKIDLCHLEHAAARLLLAVETSLR